MRWRAFRYIISQHPEFMQEYMYKKSLKDFQRINVLLIF
jgi:hypothetical protein